MAHLLITIEGAGQSHAREVAQALSLRLAAPLMPVEALQAAAIHSDSLSKNHYTTQAFGRLGPLASFIGISAAQGGFISSSTLRRRERKTAARLLRKHSYIVVGEALNAFCSNGLRKYEAYLYAGEDDAPEMAVQYPKRRHHGKGYDITLNSALLGIDQCVEWIAHAVSPTSA